MPWGWDTRGPVDVAIGGTVGTADEAKVTHAWPNYEADYLKHRLQTGLGKYDTSGLAGEKKMAYLEKVTGHYKEEADECLHQEFDDWLQGKHSDNLQPKPYVNEAGKPRRRVVYREGNRKVPGVAWDTTEHGEWKPTWWATASMTHLPGVREYLRAQKQKGDDADLKMNLLAEHGPQDIESAWLYFKHWVKGRPVGPETCMDGVQPWKPPDQRTPGRRIEFGNMPLHLGDRPNPTQPPPNLPPPNPYDAEQQDEYGTPLQLLRDVDESLEDAYGNERLPELIAQLNNPESVPIQVIDSDDDFP